MEKVRVRETETEMEKGKVRAGAKVVVQILETARVGLVM